MPVFVRLLHVLRKGPRARRLRAWAGVLCVTVASFWLVFSYLWKILLICLLASAGFWLIRSALRDSRSSRSSS